MITICLQ
jgi:hypothetical protein